MRERESSDELQEVVVASSSSSKHKRGFSEGKTKSPGRRFSRGSKEADTIDGRPLLEHAISEPPLRSQVRHCFKNLSKTTPCMLPT